MTCLRQWSCFYLTLSWKRFISSAGGTCVSLSSFNILKHHYEMLIVLLYHKYCQSSIGKFWTNESRTEGLLSRNRPVIKILDAWDYVFHILSSVVKWGLLYQCQLTSFHMESCFLYISNHCNGLLKWVSFSPNTQNSFLSIKCYRFQLTWPKASYHCAPIQERNTAWNNNLKKSL